MRLVRVHLAQRVGPALLEQPLERGAAFRLHQRVVVVGARGVDVARLGHDVVVAGEHHRQAGVEEFGGMRDSRSCQASL